MSREPKLDPIQRAVVDRIESSLAVLLIGEEEEERHVAVSDLPHGVEEGSVLRVRLDGDRLGVVELDDEAAEAQHTQIRERMTDLKRTRSSGRFQSSD